jgi:hypothetical protein
MQQQPPHLVVIVEHLDVDAGLDVEFFDTDVRHPGVAVRVG